MAAAASRQPDSETGVVSSILLVDDHPANLLALEGILEPLRQKLVRAHSGEEALKRLMRDDFSVILMDVQMPGLDGIQTARLIKEREKTRHIPIIFLTAISKEPSWVFKGYAQGAVDYLLKPFDPDILRSKVSVFVDLWIKGQRLKQHEALLRQREREELERLQALRYRALVDAMPLAVWGASSEGNVYLVNKFVEDYSGVGADPLDREWFTKFVHPDDRDALVAEWQHSLDQNVPFEQEYRSRRQKDGSYRWFLGRTVPERDQFGNVVGWIGTATDIDDQRRTREELAHFKSTLDATMDCVFIVSPEKLRFCYVNEGAVHQLGYARDDLLAMSPSEVQPEFTEEGMRRMLAPLAEGHLGSHTYRTTHKRKDGGEIPVEVVAQYIKPAGAEARYVLVARDITERVRVEDALRRANESKDAFMAAASHELRTPLAAAKAQAQLAVRRLGAHPDERTARTLGIISNQIDRMAKLVEDLLDVNHLQTGRLSLEVTDFCLAELARDVRERVQSLTTQHAIETRAPARVPMRGDRGRIDQVITNLLSNAIRYSPKGGPIFVVLELEPGGVHIAVTDHGVGIPKDKQDLVFERFGRAHGSKYGGLGLGLTISQGIVEQHGGRISVESAGEPGKGSTFHVRLPANPTEIRTSKDEIGSQPP